MLYPLIQNWWAMALRGMAAIIFGVLCLIWPGITLQALTYLFGAYAFADGVFALVAALRRAGRESRWWALLFEGIVGVAAGVITFMRPGLTALLLVDLIAAWAIVTGALEIGTAIILRKLIEGEWLMMFLGALSILFGIYIAAFPQAGALSLVWVIGAFAITFGVLMLILAFELRSHRERRHEMPGAPGMASSR
jgi:uncharacterized membrane protein HdeD (DUF308 family)